MSFLRPDNVLSKHSVDHDHHGTDKFETPGLKMLSLEDDVGHCDNIISWDDSEKIPAEEEEVMISEVKIKL